MLSGRRMPSSSANFSAGMILPRAMPAMSGMMASTSEMPWSRKNCWISFAIKRPLVLLACSGSRRSARGGGERARSAALQALGQTLAARGPEGGEQRAGEIVAHDLPFRVPLHGEREARGVLHAEGFDDAIRCARLDGEAVAEPIHALPVQGIHADAIGAGEPAQHAALLQHHVVSRAVLDVQG